MTDDLDDQLSSAQPDGVEYGEATSVGYCRPPSHNRWKKGQSGNPKGRAKGQRNLKTDLREELNEIVRISESGAARKITKQRALLKSLVARGIKGDARSAHILLTLVKELLDEDMPPPTQTALSPQEQAIIDRFIEHNNLEGNQE